MSNGELIPIIRKPSKKFFESRSMKKKEQYVPLKGRTSEKTKVVTPINLKQDTQTWVSVQFKKSVLVVIEPNKRL